jgi:hypothetical protein
MPAVSQFDPFAPYRGAAVVLSSAPNPYVWPRSRRRRAILGSITPDQAAEEIFPAAKIRSGAGHNQKVRDLMVQAVSAGQMLDPSGAPGYSQAGDCGATGTSTNVRLAQTSAGLALTGTTVGLAISGVVTAAALAPWTLGISAIIGLFPIIFGHHAAAVKKEQSVLCAAVPAANNYLQIIDQAVSQGMASPADGQAALDSLVSGFQKQVSGIIHGADPTSSGQCNAACVMLSQLRAICAFKKSAYQDLITTSPAAASSPGAAVTAAAASIGLPSWALWLIGGVVLYQLVT